MKRDARRGAPTATLETRRPQIARGAPPGEVRIIGGAWKRSKLAVLDRPGLRPTPGRVRVTLFNWLGADLTGWRCLDAYAGSGALGFEAASRGAAEVVLLERDRALVLHLDQARVRLRADAVRVENAEAIAWMARCAPDRFDLVLLDPPFESHAFEAALVAAVRVVAEGGWIYLEADHGIDPAGLPPLGVSLHRQGRAGAVHFHLLRRSGG